jgi:glutamyl endopeptidase
MTTPTSPGQPTGPHTPVTNRPETESTAAVTQPVSEPPSPGVDPRMEPPREDGTEAVTAPARPESIAVIIPPMMENLQDVGAASFGSPRSIAETVHGPDNRIQIPDTTRYPWRCHCSLLITAADGSGWIGTGWFVGPHTLATAGHCVYIKNSGIPGRDGWVLSIQVMPGRNGTRLPYGAVTSTRFSSVTGWTEGGDENYDYGAIILPTDVGNETGWFGFGAYPDQELKNAVCNISGYPSDKSDGTQWYDRHQIADVTATKVSYDIDTLGGQSGSAVYRILNGGQYGIAIHAYGGAVYNSGTRISLPVFNNLKAWKA